MSTGVQTTVGTFVWHEHDSGDVERARSFYGELLGWKTELWSTGEGDYPMIKVGEQTHGGFSAAQGGAPPHWIGYVLVEDVDETVRRAEAAGGKLVAGPIDVPEVGRIAVVADPQGAVISTFSPAGDAPAPGGVFVWDELLTSDVDAAKSFYTEIFGWRAEDMEMGAAGPYTMFRRPGNVDVAGCMRMPDSIQAPPHWLVYVATDDVDATAARAQELGGSVYQQGMDIPGIGRIAVVADPLGAVFGLFAPPTG